MTMFTQYIADETAMLNFGQKLVNAVRRLDYRSRLVFYLKGQLGAGKTTLSRGIVQALGYQGKVKSPTYTLVEEYHFPEITVYHFDLYRLSDPEELEFMGIRDYFSDRTLCLIEWAEKGEGILPEADLLITIDYAEESRQITLFPQNRQAIQLVEILSDLT